MSEKDVVVIIKDKCTGCTQCVSVCPTGALEMKEGLAVVDPKLCNACGECVEVCPAEAMFLPGGPPEAKEKPAAEAPASRLAEAAKPAPPPAEGREVWVFVEQTEGKAANVSWELIGKGAELASDLGGLVAAAVLGGEVEPLAREAISYGASKVYLVEDPVLAHYRTQPYLHAMLKLIEERRPEVFLLGATTMGRDLAGAVATYLRTGLTADCTGLTIDPSSKLLEQTRPAYGGNIMATILCEQRRPQMATVRPRVMVMPPRDDSRQGEIVRRPLGLTEEEVPVRLLEYVREGDGGGARIEEADVIVAGGRGLGSAEGFNLLKELADVLGGVVAGSRGAVDKGWIEQSRQVGQTGKTVRPKFYVACGISGAVQHLVGMQTSDVILAVNSDPNAPIFSVATYGIVGDLYQVVPALIREFKSRLGGRPNPGEQEARTSG
jgi:electron transfer flavoprotein alpha subunit